MPHRKTTFSKFIIEDQRRTARHGPELAGLLNDVQTACKFIGVAIARGALGAAEPTVAADVEVCGGAQKSLEAVSNDIMLSICEWGGQTCGMVCEGLEGPYQIPAGFPRGRYLLVFDPLDGASNLDVNMSVGTIFSVLSAPDGVSAPAIEDFLQPGIQQVAAGYALYGPVSMLVATLGAGVHGFTLDPQIGAYTLTHPNMLVPEMTRELSIDASNERFWEPPVRRYIQECVAGKSGPRGEDFNMRWIASMTAEVHRILIRGGLFISPRDTRDTTEPGRLGLLYEANPMAMLIEQAGGVASTARGRILELEPSHIHQRVPVVLGSRQEVERVARYHAAYDGGEDLVFASPLFNTRSLFRSS
jgi:fructose-1,6-bisphosphatase